MLAETVQGWYDEAERKGFKIGFKKGYLAEKTRIVLYVYQHTANKSLKNLAMISGLKKKKIKRILKKAKIY